MSTADTLESLKRDALSGALAQASSQQLEEYAAALCHSQAFSMFGAHEFPQVCETVRIHLLRAHIDNLQAHITRLDAKNTFLSWVVIALAVASVVGTAIQSTVAIRSERRAVLQSEAIAAQPQPQALTPATPSHPEAQASDPAMKN